MGTKLSRRGLLGAAAVLTVSSACSGACDAPEAAPSSSASADAIDPLVPLLDEAVALAGAYTQISLSQPGLASRLTPLAADHQAHADELRRVLGSSPSAPAVVASAPAGAASTVAGLRQAELDAQQSAAALCRTIDADRAELVGSIAACRATHAEALR